MKIIEKLIKLDDAIEACSEAQGRSDSKGFLRGVSSVWSKIKKIPVVETEITGEWIIDEFGHKCSECNEYVNDNTYENEPLTFCPNCGTKMHR